MDAAGVHVRTDAGRRRPAGPARGRPRTGRRLRPPLPRPRPAARAVAAAGAVPRGRARRGDAPGTRRPRRRPSGTRSVVLAHAFVAGCRPATPSATSASAASRWSPRRSSTASTTPRSATSTVPTSLSDTVRYSGSPLAYSFSEAEQRKGSWLVDLDAGGVRRRRVRRRRRSRGRWRVLRGELDALLTDPALADHEAAWLAGHAHRRPAARCGRWSGCAADSPTPWRCCSSPTARAEPTPPRPRLRGRSDHDITLDFVSELRGSRRLRRRAALLR